MREAKSDRLIFEGAMLLTTLLFTLSCTSSPTPSVPLAALSGLAGGTWEARVETPSKEVLLYSETFEQELGGKFLLARQTISDADGRILRTTIGLIGQDPGTGALCSWIFLSDGGHAKACTVATESDRAWIFEGEAHFDAAPAKRLRTRFSLPETDLLVNEVFFFDAAAASWGEATRLTFRRKR